MATKQTIDRVGGDADSLFSGGGKINDNFDGIYNYRAINAIAPPSGTACVGDGERTSGTGTDDTAAIQAMIDAGIAAGGVCEIQFPGRRNYIVTSTIEVPSGAKIVGVGGRNAEDSGPPPRFVWNGAEDGTMFMVGEGGNNIVGAVFRNVSMVGRSDGTNRPATFIRYGTGGAGADSPDSGCYLDNVFFDNCRSHAVKFDVGATNYYINGCRWDNCGQTSGGYGIYCHMTAGFKIHILGHSTYTAEAGSGGFMYINTEDVVSGTPHAHVNIDSLTVEIDGDLLETYAGGTDPYDKRGVIRLGVNSADIGNISHHIHCKSLIVEKPASGVSSFCVFQITATAGTDAANSNMVSITVDGASGLGEGQTDSDADDIIRPIGGRVPADRKPPSPYNRSGRWGRFQWGQGMVTGYGLERVVSYTYAPSNYIQYPLIRLEAKTVANLPTAADGLLQYVSDADTPIVGTNVTGGGSTLCLVMYSTQGTDGWKVVQVFGDASPGLPSYTVAGVPSAATWTRGLIYVSNETGGAVPAFSDGTNWRRVTDRAIIAA